MRRAALLLLNAATLVAACGGTGPPAGSSPTAGAGATATAASTTKATLVSTGRITPRASASLSPLDELSRRGPTGPTQVASVVRVVDGDTIIVRIGGTQERLRYIGMNAPETVKPNTPVERMGPEASAANHRLVDGQTVTLEKDVSERDQYGRLLRDVWLRHGDGWLLVNLELVRLGFAQVSTFPPDVKYVDDLLLAQRAARSAGVGLWGP